MNFLLLAAVIAQPLDAVYSTAGDPKACGLAVSLRYPAAWATAPSEHAHGIVDFGSADNSVVMSLWISDRIIRWSAPTEREKAAVELYRDALFEALEAFVPAGCELRRAATAVEGKLPAAKVYFRSSEVSGQVVGFVFDRRVVMLWSMCRGPAAARFGEFAPLFQAVLDSVHVEADAKPWPVVPIIGVAALLTAIIGVVVHRRRSTSSACANRLTGRQRRRTHPQSP